MKIIRRFVSAFLVLCLFVGDLGLIALAESVLALPSSTIGIEEEAFYGAHSIDRVVLPEGILEISNRAFANSSIKTINLPSSITYIADDAFDGTMLNNVSAVEGTYAYDWAVAHHYITPKVSIAIRSICANVTTIETGMPITWTVDAEGGVVPLSFNYAVFKNGLYQDSLSVSESNEPLFVLTPTTDGYWSVLVTISDSLGTIISEISDSVYAVDTATYGDIQVTLTQNLDTYLVGDTVQIVATQINSYGAVKYAFSVENSSGSIIERQEESSKSIFSFATIDSGIMTITCTMTDELGRSVTEQKEIYIYSEYDLKPAAPQGIQLNGEDLPDDPTYSKLYSQQSLIISWGKNNNADSYLFQVFKIKDDANVMLLEDDGLTDTSYTLPVNLFSSIEQDNLIQVRVAAQNRVTSDFTVGYFNVKTREQQSIILIDGKNTVAWNEVFYEASEREFQIDSNTDWSFSSDQNWISCSRIDNRLIVQLDENTNANNTLSGTITINNGYSIATIDISHGSLRKAPQILEPNLSTDLDIPTHECTKTGRIEHRFRRD